MRFMDNSRKTLTPEEEAELKRLRFQYAAATKRALRAIMGEGMSSRAFREADEEAGLAARRIKQILGTPGKHWMAQ
jgi:hypothetical protein